jgi:hypothetical protein
MAITIQPPQPGDLISSDFMKKLIDQLVGLDQRLAALEGVTPGANGKVHISRIVPAEVVPGDVIQIIGVNFGLPTENVVTFDGGNPVIPTSGNDKLLTVVVPSIDLGNAASKSVTVAVSSSARGFDSAAITVDAIQTTIPSGKVTVSPGTIPGNIVAGSDVIFPFTIEARTNLDETYNLSVGLPTVPATQTPWTFVITSDAAGTRTLVPPLLIPKPASGQAATTAQVFVKVTIPLNTPVTSPFVRLDVNSVHNPPPNAGSPSGGFTAPFQFNQVSQPPQTIRFAIDTFAGTGVTGNLTMVSFPLPTPTAPPINGISYIFQNVKSGQYDFTLEWQDKTNGNRGWTASFGGAPGIGTWPTMTRRLTLTAGDFGPDKVAIVGIAGATPNTLIVTVRAVGANAQTDYGILNQGIKAA